MGRAAKCTMVQRGRGQRKQGQCKAQGKEARGRAGWCKVRSGKAAKQGSPRKGKRHCQTRQGTKMKVKIRLDNAKQSSA